MNGPSERSVVMLLVEDNTADVAFFEEALEASRTRAAVHVVSHGEEALQFLRCEEPYAGAPRPAVIVLDLNLPVKNGRETLLEIAADPALNTAPVVVLTTSVHESNVCDLYPEGRGLFFTKTDDFRRMQEIVREIAAAAREA